MAQDRTPADARPSAFSTTFTPGGKRRRPRLRATRRRWTVLAALTGGLAATVLPIAAQPVVALPSTHEITANWYGNPTPTDAPYGAAITSEWHINTNDDGDPYSNEPVDNVRASLTVTNGVFVSIPTVCKTTGVDPVSEISPDGTMLLCNVGTITEGTATVIQAPVRVSGVGVDLFLSAEGTVTSDEAVAPGGPASPNPLPITYTHGMDLSLFQAPGSQYQGAVKESSRTLADRTFIQMNFSIILSEGSMPGPSDYSFPVAVTTSIPGALTGFQWEGCEPVSASSRSTGQPYSDPAVGDRTNFPGCTVAGSGTNYTVSLTGLTYDLINTPTNDSMGQPLPGTGAYIASGTVQFSIPSPVTQLTDFIFTAAPPQFTFIDGQSFPDVNAANNVSSATLTAPGGFSNHWTGTPANSRGAWDANLWVSPGTSEAVVIPVPGIETRQDWLDTYAGTGLPIPPLPLYMQVNSKLWENYAGEGGEQMAGVCTMSQNPDFVITHMDGGGWWGNGTGDTGTAYENYETARYFYTTQTLDTKTETCGQAAPSAMWIEVFPDPGTHLEDPRIGIDSLIDLEAMGITGATAVKMTWDPAVDVSPHTFLRGLGYIDPTAPTSGEGWTIGTGNGPNGNPWPGFPELNGWGNGSDRPGGVEIPGSTYGNTNGYRDAFRLQGPTGIITKTTPQTTAEPGVEIEYSLTVEAELSITEPPNQTFPVIDILPEGLVYVDGSASIAPTSVSPDGRTIRWDFVDVPANVEIPFTYRAVRPLDSVLTPGSVLTNVAEIQVPGDQRPAASRQARESVVVPSSSSTNLMKTLEDGMLNFYGDDSAWLLTIGSQDPLNNEFTDTIDVLPYVGDGRGTDVSGTTPYTVTGVTAPVGSTIYYTTDPAAGVSLDPRAASNGAPGTTAGATTSWIEIAADTPPPADATAIRVIGPALAPGATHQIRIGFTTPAGTDCLTPVPGENRPDEILVNSAGSYAGHTRLPMLSSATATIAGCVDFRKDFQDLTRLADGTYDVEYTLTAEGVGQVLDYDLVDDMQYGDAIVINEVPAPPTATFMPDPPEQTPVTVLNTWDPVATTLTVAEDVPIADGEVHVYSVLVNVSVDGGAVTWENTNCIDEGNEGGNTGLHNTATLTNPDVTIPDEACPEVPYVEHEKNVLSGPTPIGDGLYEVEYQIDVRNIGAGADLYDLSDEFRFGEAVTIVGTPTVANTVPGDIATLGTWDPATTTLAIVADAPIAGSTVDGPEVHSYVVTVQVSVDAPSVTFENTDCEMGEESGTGLDNESTLTVDEHLTNDDACVPISEPVHTKTVSAGPTPLGNGTYEVEYTIEVANHGAADSVYDLVDDFQFGEGIAIEGTPTVANTVPGDIATLGTWDPATSTLAIVDSEPILAGAPAPGDPVVHEYVVTVIVSVDAPALTVANSDCTMGVGDTGTGLFNSARMTVNGEPVDRDACPPISEPAHVKTIASGPTPMGDNKYEIEYAITVTNAGAAEGTYDLVDDFQFGSSVTIEGTPTVTNTSPGGITTLGTWDPAATTLEVVADQTIAAGTPQGATRHEYRVTVVVSVDPETSTALNTDCDMDDATGTGLFNTATMTVNGEEAERDACAALPHFTITKTIAEGPTRLPNGQYEINYAIRVTNDGAGDGTYDLTDTLTYGANVTVVSTTITGTDPGGIATNQAWNGRTNTTVAADIDLAASGVHTYRVRVTFTVPVGATGAANDCTLDAGESGTGLLNTALVNNNGNQQAAEACAMVVPPPPTPAPAPEIPATGGDSMHILQAGVLLLTAGALVVIATRRRRPATT